MTFSIETYLKKYDTLNQELRAHWMMGREAARNVGVKINELVSNLHKEHKDWNIKKIAYTIAGANDDLEGFSYQTVYAHLNEDHKALLDSSKQNSKKNVLEESASASKHNIIEESSSDPNIPTDYNFQDAVIEEPKQYDEKQEDDEELEDENLTHDWYEDDEENVGNNKQQQQQKSNIQLVTKENERLKRENEEYQQKIKELSIIKIREEEIKKQLPEKVVKVAEQVGLSTSKLELLTNSKLRKHPAIQKSLVDTIKDFSIQKAIITVEQKIRDIETGALVKTGKDSYTIDYDKREKIDTRINPVKSSVEKYLEILDEIHDLLDSLTGHKIARGQSEYEQKHIDHSEPYRIDILKDLSVQQKSTLFKDLSIVSDAIDSYIDIIENESDGRKRAE